jgi:2-polyprenyl-3-methyl-5-hydroxy-6-metoxy-1,4-benzoquinol methylase
MSIQDGGRLHEEDIRPAALMAEKQEHLEWDMNFLLSRKDEWVLVECPACGSARHREHGSKRGFVYVECISCGTVFTNPRPSLAVLHEFYAQSRNYDYWNKHIFPKTEARRRESIFRPRAERTARFVEAHAMRGGTLLEVGAAYGMFCEELKALNVFDRIIAVEPTPALAATCRKRGIETLQSPIEEVKLSGAADVVASFEVIEHLFSPRAFVLQCARLLKAQGLLILTCPNVRGFDVGTLGIESGTFDHEHLNYFHTRSLPSLLENCAFRTLHVETPGKLDVDIVRKKFQEGVLDLSGNFFLRELFTRNSERELAQLQDFLAANCLSSHMWVVAQKMPR